MLNINLAYGLETDNNHSMIIKSNKFEVDYRKGEAYYSGNVKLSQGTRDLTADILYIYFENSKNTNKTKDSKNTNNINQQKIKEIKAFGQSEPVIYSETLKDKTNKVFAQAKIMTLIPNQDLLTLENNAIIEQNGRKLTSEVLHYNMKKEVAYTPKVENKRTKFIMG